MSLTYNFSGIDGAASVVQSSIRTIQGLLDEGHTGDTGPAQAKALPCNTSSGLLQAEIDGSQAGDQDALDLVAMDASAASRRQLQSFVAPFERPVEPGCVPRGAPRCEA
jgi:hypothetical protein